MNNIHDFFPGLNPPISSLAYCEIDPVSLTLAAMAARLDRIHQLGPQIKLKLEEAVPKKGMLRWLKLVGKSVECPVNT
jgi:hypothetical protein